MNGNVTEINVQQACVCPCQDSQQRFELDPRNLPWLVEQLPKPETPQKMCGRFADNMDWLKWKEVGVLAFLRDDNGTHALESDDLPVNVLHLRFKKRRAIGCDDGRRRRNVQRSTLNAQR